MSSSNIEDGACHKPGSASPNSATPPCKIHVSCHEPLVDDLLHIWVSALPSHHHVTLLARLEDDGNRLYSFAHYKASLDGHCDLQIQHSTGGTYTGLEPMGLFWSMKQEPEQKPGVRIVKRIATTPLVTSISVLDGHCDSFVQLIEAKPIASTVIKRWYLSKNVVRVEIREDGLYGTLFIQKDGGPYPGVVDLFGGAGGMIEQRAALLASKGFAALALQYITTVGESMELKSDMEYFEGAVEWLLRHPRVISHSAGVVGTSKGAEVAILMGITCHKVKAVVSINGLHVVGLCDMQYDGERFYGIDFKDMVWKLKDGTVRLKQMISDIPQHVKEKCIIPVERSNAHILFVIGADDGAVGVDSTDFLLERMKQHGKSHLCERIVYEGAGHLLEPPYTPLYKTSYDHNAKALMLYGGETRPHTLAQEDLWPRMIDFLKTRLTGSQL